MDRGGSARPPAKMTKPWLADQIQSQITGNTPLFCIPRGALGSRPLQPSMAAGPSPAQSDRTRRPSRQDMAPDSLMFWDSTSRPAGMLSSNDRVYVFPARR
jgi:hypothetical protein